ncbi:hypothetical protein D9M68_686120 [compost metagenome]
MLDQVHAGGFQPGDGARRVGFVPGLVHVYGHAGAVAQRLLDARDVSHVVRNGAPAYLELEGIVAAALQQRFGFLDIADGIAAGQGPQHRQAGAHRAAQQRRHGHAQAFALRVQQCAFQRRFRVAIAARHGRQTVHGRVDVGGIQAGQGRRQVGVDGQLDALRAFLAIGQAADGGGFADAFDAVAAAQAHDHQRLALHDCHGQLVGADRRQVHQDGLDGENACLIHTFSARGSTITAVWLAFSPGVQDYMGSN